MNITSFESWAFSPEFKRKSSLKALFAIETFADRLHPVYAKPKSLVITKKRQKENWFAVALFYCDRDFARITNIGVIVGGDMGYRNSKTSEKRKMFSELNGGCCSRYLSDHSDLPDNFVRNLLLAGIKSNCFPVKDLSLGQ